MPCAVNPHGRTSKMRYRRLARVVARQLEPVVKRQLHRRAMIPGGGVALLNTPGIASSAPCRRGDCPSRCDADVLHGLLACAGGVARATTAG